MESQKVRNVALIGQVGTGKTTLGESILFRAKAIDRLGRVDEGTTVLDFEPEEIKRHASVSSAFGSFRWKGLDVTVIDTPGTSVFLADSYTCLEAADAAVLVLDGQGGIRIQSERLASKARALGLPLVVFASKMDRERADLEALVAEAGERFGQRLVPVSIPMMANGTITGVVDLLHARTYVGALADGAEAKEAEVPAEMRGAVDAARKALVEAVAETDDALLERYLEDEHLSDDDVEHAFDAAVRAGKLVPMVTGSGLRGVGMEVLMDLVIRAVPPPTEHAAVVGTDPKTHAEVVRNADPAAPFSARVVKTIADPFAGRVTVFRVISGTLQPDSNVYNSTRQVRERFGHLFVLEGKKQIAVDSAGPGTIVAVAKLKETLTGDTLCDEKHPVVYPPLKEYPAAVTFAVQAASRGDEDKLATALHRLREEDPFIRVGRDPQTSETLLSGLGQAHVEVTVEKIRRKFGVSVELKEPKVPYRETIRGRTQIQGRHKRQTGGRGQYGDAWLEIEPMPRGGGFEFVDKIVGGVVPRQYIPSVEKGVRDAMTRGVVAGYPVVDVKVTLFDGSYHDVDSSDMAFQIAASKGFKKGFLQCSPVLLEPVVHLEISVPDDCMGDVNGDIIRRRGRVVGMDSGGGMQTIKAMAPYAEVLRYAADLKSLTGDRGDFTLEFSHYDEVPGHIAEKIIAAARRPDEEEE